MHYGLSALTVVMTLLIALIVGVCTHRTEQSIKDGIPVEGKWKICFGDDVKYAQAGYDDSSWDEVSLPGSMIRKASNATGELKGILWIRKSVYVDGGLSGNDLGIILGQISNADECYFNGVKIGGTGSFPPDEFSMWYYPRYYAAPKTLVRYGEVNVMAVRLSYNIFCDVRGPLAITGMENWKQSGTFVKFNLITLNYIIIAAGVPIFLIFFFFFIKKRTSREYIFCCFQLVPSLFIILDLCSYWNIYGTPLVRLKILGFSWAALMVSHPMFLHRVYGLTRRKTEITLLAYLFTAAFFLIIMGDRPSALAAYRVFVVFCFFAGFYGLYCHLSALNRKSPYAKFFTFFGVIFFVGAAHDGFIYLSKFAGRQPSLLGYDFPYMLFPFAAAVLFSGMTLMLVSRFIGMTDQLGKMNATLESRVHDRTVELEKARDALWGEMELARKIQTVLLPVRPSIPGYEISAYMKPAAEVGGDYYDVINADGRDWLAIGDVSGHGVPAGLVMMMMQTAVHTAVKQNPALAPSQLLILINGTITQNIQSLNEERYMTITIMATHRNGEFAFSGLHQDIMVYRAASDSVEMVETSGFWIGIKDDITGMVKDDYLSLNIGDAMLVYTDGITEAWRKGSPVVTLNREEYLFGPDRLEHVFHSMGKMNPDSIKDGILQALNDYDARDDITLVVVKRVQ